MLKNLSFLAMAGALAFATSMTGCILVTDDTSTIGDADQGDGDGDSESETAGDGDGDADQGDGDGDGDAGDGDGDAGDGDGDAGDGDGDGDTGAAACGWSAADGYYVCGGMDEDPNPTACPEGLNQGDACDAVDPVLTDIGCCDAEGNNWYCAEDPDDPDAGTFQNMDMCG